MAKHGVPSTSSARSTIRSPPASTRTCASTAGSVDAWPELFERVLAADILVIAGPIWLGDNSSETKKIIERLYAHSGELNDKGQWLYYGKVGGCLITGNEDGIKHCASNVLYSLQHIGYSIPPQADAGWIGEAGPGAELRRRAGGRHPRRPRQRVHQPQHDVHDLEPAAPGPDAARTPAASRPTATSAASGTPAPGSTSRTPSTARSGGIPGSRAVRRQHQTAPGRPGQSAGPVVSLWCQPSHHSLSGSSPAVTARERSAVVTRLLPGLGHGVDEPGQLGPAAAGDLLHQVLAGGHEGEQDLAPVGVGAVAADQPLADEPLAHPGAGGRVDAQLGGDVDHALRPAGRQHDERPVLRQGHLGVQVGQRAGGQADHDAAGRQQRVDQVLAGRWVRSGVPLRRRAFRHGAIMSHPVRIRGPPQASGDPQFWGSGHRPGRGMRRDEAGSTLHCLHSAAIGPTDS